MKGLYAVPLGVPFLSTFVEELITQTASDPLILARYLVILPTRRGCLMLQEAFLKATPNGCRILPRIIALADIEEGGELPEYLQGEMIPPAMPAWQRLGLITQLVLAFETQKEGGTPNAAGSLRLAQELMRLVDEVETTGLNLHNLKTLVGTDYAAHWQLTLDFLKIVTDLWPPILEQEGFIEPAARKRLILEQVATHWQPKYPVILAGTTGTRPSTAKLAKAILNFDRGSVVLAGVDPDILIETENPLPPTHPQYTLTQFIQYLKNPLIWLTGSKKISPVSLFLSKAMEAMPQADWQISTDTCSQVLSSIQAIEASCVLEEARQIALILRYELETPGQVIALVTPDKELTRRIRSALRRWNLQANLSSGIPFPQTVVGRFLALSSLLTQNISSAELLSLLKHPLYGKGRNRFLHLKETRKFEIEILRRLTPQKIHTLPFPGHEICTPLLALNDGKKHSFRDFLQAHKTVAEALVGYPLDSDSLPIKSLLWSEDDGEVALSFWESLLEQAHNYPPLMAQDYPAFLRNLMAQEVVRDGEGIGSRILILGALEARLLQADVIILGGLNEGTWPGVSEEDPWLSRSMRESFGLPPLERKIGLSAHDFCTSMTAPKVYITRSLKRNGAPTLPSRWWQRLAALLSTAGGELRSTQPWSTWSFELDQPQERIHFTPPAPCPPLSARPRRLSVTEVETLLQDPYSIYAKKILNLRPLDPLEADLSLAERGQAIHQILDAFVRSGMDPASPNALRAIEDLGRQAFGDLLADPRAITFWWPRFQRVAAWFLNQLMADQSQIAKTQTEVEGAIEIPTAMGPIVLSAKADRIDFLTSSQACIIDYKTGMTPTKKSVMLGYSPQLSLEGVILKVGGFCELPPMTVERLAYWKVTGGTPAGEILPFENPTELIECAERGVRRLFEAFLGKEIPFPACPNPSTIPLYHDYAHLERIKEWG
jgi:ATP-dependent helicase/nuclease subunit B